MDKSWKIIVNVLGKVSWNVENNFVKNFEKDLVKSWKIIVDVLGKI